MAGGGYFIEATIIKLREKNYWQFAKRPRGNPLLAKTCQVKLNKNYPFNNVAQALILENMTDKDIFKK